MDEEKNNGIITWRYKMSIIKKLTVSIILVAITLAFWIIPDPVPAIDEIILTMITVGNIGKQFLKTTDS